MQPEDSSRFMPGCNFFLATVWLRMCKQNLYSRNAQKMHKTCINCAWTIGQMCPEQTFASVRISLAVPLISNKKSNA